MGLWCGGCLFPTRSYRWRDGATARTLAAAGTSRRQLHVLSASSSLHARAVCRALSAGKTDFGVERVSWRCFCNVMLGLVFWQKKYAGRGAHTGARGRVCLASVHRVTTENTPRSWSEIHTKQNSEHIANLPPPDHPLSNKQQFRERADLLRGDGGGAHCREQVHGEVRW